MVPDRAISLLGHLIRLPDADPMKQVTLRNNKPILPPTRRVGRPKHNWARHTFEMAWRVAKSEHPSLPGQLSTGLDEQYLIIEELARLRKAPFNTKKLKQPETTQSLTGEHCSHTTHLGEQSSHPTHRAVGHAPPTAQYPALQSFVAGAPLAVQM